MKLSIAAASGKVILIGDGKPLLAMTPEVAEEVCADLPRYAALARILKYGPVQARLDDWRSRLESVVSRIKSLLAGVKP